MPRCFPLLAAVARVVVALPLAASALGCTAGESEVSPPAYDFYFPTGLAMSPDEKFLFVLNANADLRYDSATVQAVDLDAVDALLAQWMGSKGMAPLGCAALADRPYVLSCPTSNAGQPAAFMVPGASVKVGNFGAALAVEPLAHGGAPSSRLRVFATVRGDPSLTWMDFDTATRTMDCGSAAPFDKCAQDHRLARFLNDPSLFTLAPEPFYLYADAGTQHVYLTHLTLGYVSMADAPVEDSQAPMLVAEVTNLWTPTVLTGALGAVGVAPRAPGDPNGLIYITSRQEARVATVRAVVGNPVTLADGTVTRDEALVRGPSFFYSGIANAGDNGDARGLVFTPDGNRMYIVNRTPPSLQMFDTSLDATGAPANAFMAIAETCEQPATLALTDFGEGTRLLVPCFAKGELWVFEGDRLDLVTAEPVGRGPTSVVASPRRRRVYIADYAQDTLAVLDATPGSPTQNRVLLQLGIEREAQVTPK
jgi:DNA-binding beta-propeller fold protein YncE